MTKDDFTAEEFQRLLGWAHEGLLTTPNLSKKDRALFDRLDTGYDEYRTALTWVRGDS